MRFMNLKQITINKNIEFKENRDFYKLSSIHKAQGLLMKVY